MAWVLAGCLSEDDCGLPPLTRRDMILPRVVACIDAVTPRAGWAREYETHLLRDLCLDGRLLMQLGELLEAEFGITLVPAVLIDLAWDGPTIGGVLRMLERHGA